VILDDTPTDRETQSRAALFSRKKCIEYPVLVLERYSGSRVLNINGHCGFTVEASRHSQTPLIGWDGPHCLNSVFDQVQDNLLYLCMRGVYLRKILLVFGGSNYGLSSKVVLNQRYTS